jgi:hypothetical protein
VSSGFEVETEMTVQALFYNMTITEVSIEYRARPAGSFSKLRSYRDGFAITLQVFHLLRAYKPLTTFGGLGLACLATAGVFGATMVLLGALLISIGVILHSLNFRVKELHSVITRRPSS